jgi:hypothetical protein
MPDGRLGAGLLVDDQTSGYGRADKREREQRFVTSDVVHTHLSVHTDLSSLVEGELAYATAKALAGAGRTVELGANLEADG